MAIQDLVFIIVPGAYCDPELYAPLPKHLRALGYDSRTVRLPSLDPVDTTTTCAADTQAVREVVLEVLDTGKDVIVVPHSYGGLPGGGAAYSLDKTSRASKPVTA